MVRVARSPKPNFPPKICDPGVIYTDSKIFSMDLPQDAPPKPPEAIAIDLTQPGSSSSKFASRSPRITQLELAGLGVGPLGEEEVAVGLDRRG